MAQTFPSWSRFRFLAATVLLPLTLACEQPATAPPCHPGDEVGFAPREGFDPQARARRVDCGFRSSALHVRGAADGSSWVLHGEFADGTFSAPSEKLLTHLGAGGERLEKIVLPDFVERFAVHPSGELTVIGWGEAPGPLEIRLRRIRPDGSLVAERLFRNETPPEERLQYFASADGSVQRVNLPEEQRGVGVLAAEAVGEDVYLLVNTDGLRITRLDSALEARWTTTVSVTVVVTNATNEELRALGGPFRGFPMTVDEAGRPYVALPFLTFQRRAYLDAFGRVPEGPDTKAMLLVGLESTGEPRVARTVAASTSEEIVGLVVRGGAFAIGTHAKTPIDQPDKTFGSDLFFASGRWDRPASEAVSRPLSLDNDDVPVSLTGCGAELYCFAGHTGFVDLDRKPTTTPGKGFVLQVDAQGEQKRLALLEGPRDTQIIEAAEAPGGDVLFAVLTNEPPTVSSVPNGLKDNELWLGVFDAP